MFIVLMIGSFPSVTASSGLSISLGKTSYSAGESVIATVRELSSSGSPQSNDLLQASWVEPSGFLLRKGSAITDAQGIATFVLVLESTYPMGTWRLDVAGTNSSATAYFQVQGQSFYLLTVLTYGVSSPIWIDGKLSQYATNVTFSILAGAHTIELSPDWNGYTFTKWSQPDSSNPELNITVAHDIIVSAVYVQSGFVGENIWYIALLAGVIFAVLGILIWLRQEGYLA